MPSIAGAPTTFYRNRGDDGTVNLNRLNTNVITPTGLFCCEVPDGFVGCRGSVLTLVS